MFLNTKYANFGLASSVELFGEKNWETIIK